MNLCGRFSYVCLNPFVYFIGIMVLHDLLCKVSELSNMGKEKSKKVWRRLLKRLHLLHQDFNFDYVAEFAEALLLPGTK